jgi:hypothetical protein
MGKQRPLGKEKYQSMENKKIGKERGNIRKLRALRRKGTHKHMEV